MVAVRPPGTRLVRCALIFFLARNQHRFSAKTDACRAKPTAAQYAMAKATSCAVTQRTTTPLRCRARLARRHHLAVRNDRTQNQPRRYLFLRCADVPRDLQPTDEKLGGCVAGGKSGGLGCRAIGRYLAALLFVGPSPQQRRPACRPFGATSGGSHDPRTRQRPGHQRGKCVGVRRAQGLSGHAIHPEREVE